MSLKGQVALITGGSRGIGAATVRMFVSAGALVVFNYVRARAEAEKLVEECGTAVCRAEQADLKGTADAEKLVRSAIEHFGAMDALVVNHGIWLGDDVDVDGMTDEQWHTTIATNLDSAFALAKYSVAQMTAAARRKYCAHQLNRRSTWRSGAL
jgi:3-oxoacyl-[acyl-carrier protein] reductase